LVLKRIAAGVFSIWAVLSVIFLLFVGGKKWHLSSIIALDAFAAQMSGSDFSETEIEETTQEYLAQRGLDRPMDELYIDWMTNMFTLQWGESFESGHEAFPAVMSSAGRTATYVLPAVVVATVLGLGIGVLTAMQRRSRGAGVLRGLTYAGMGLPNFWLGSMLLLTAGAGVAFTPVNLTGLSGFPEIETRQLPFRYDYLLPFLLVATTLLGAIVSYTRAYARQYYADNLTKHVRAKGGGELAVARHVLRNAAVPLVSLLFAETLALIALSVFVVEAVFAIDGIGTLFYNAVWRQDLPIVMGATMVIVSFGIAGNITQDVLHSMLDPRVGTDSL
jgi:peptide/nickel transport system permease protein